MKNLKKIFPKINMTKLLTCLSIFIIITTYSLTAEIICRKADTIMISHVGTNSERYYIDFNNDGDYDFGFYHFFPAPNDRYGEIWSTGSKKGKEIHSLNERLPVKLNLGDEISGSLSGWFDIHFKSNACLEGDWAGSVDKFIAIRLKINNDYCYGWIRVNIPEDNSSFTIVDYAYEDTPNKSIKAGEGIISSVDDFKQDKEINTSIINNSLLIEFKNSIMDKQLEIFDFSGRKIISESINSTCFYYSFEHWKSGIYFLVLKFNDKRIVKKIII